MKKILIFMLVLGNLFFVNAQESSGQSRDGYPENDMFLEDDETIYEKKSNQDLYLQKNQEITVSVTGQGVAPAYAVSPAQSYALAKRAAIADAYRLIAEKVKGVSIEGKDTVQNMMLKRSTVRTLVTAMVRNAEIVETTYKEGLCEVEMEIKLSYAQFN